MDGVDGAIGRQRNTSDAPASRGGVDARIAGLGGRQDGLAARAQLIALGLSAAAIDHRVRAGRLFVVHRGVYAIGHAALSERGRLRAAVMAAGPTAILSHRSAAARYGLAALPRDAVEVTVSRRGPRSRRGLVVHATRRPPAVRIVDGLPVTTPLRTLADLAAAPDMERLCAEALVLRLVTQRELDAARIVVPDLATPTRSVLERRFLGVIRDAGLPRPLVNPTIGSSMVDFAWPDERVIVETDGWSAHGHRAAFERDHRRDADLSAEGWLVLRFTWRQIRDRPVWAAARVAQTLGHRRALLHGAGPTGSVRR